MQFGRLLEAGTATAVRVAELALEWVYHGRVLPSHQPALARLSFLHQYQPLGNGATLLGVEH